MVDTWTLISFGVVIAFSILWGVLCAFVFGYYLLPKYQKYRMQKKAVTKIEVQTEKGYKFYDNGKIYDLKAMIIKSIHDQEELKNKAKDEIQAKA